MTVLVLCSVLMARAQSTWAVVEALRTGREAERPDLALRVGYSDLVAELATAAAGGGLPPGAPARAEALGLVLRVEDRVVRLSEPMGGQRGLGLLVLSVGPVAAEVVLQAPHPWADLDTGEITASLFDRGGVRALWVATSARGEGEAGNRDPAHDAEGMLQAATDALCRALLDPLVVQVHGYADESSDSEAVISGGLARWSPESLEALRARLASGLGVDPARVRTGAEEPALAARSNAQGALLADRARFLHLELSRSARRRLVAEAAQREALLEVLLATAARDGESR
jgi:hypothetical protein